MEKLLSKFENGEERYRLDPTFNRVIHALNNGIDPIKIIDTLLKNNEEITKNCEEYVRGDKRAFVLPGYDFDKLKIIK